jgi:hypothetical protein
MALPDEKYVGKIERNNLAKLLAFGITFVRFDLDDLPRWGIAKWRYLIFTSVSYVVSQRVSPLEFLLGDG